MRPHPRTRKTIKWTGAAALAFTFAAWLASGWWYASLCLPGVRITGLEDGCLLVGVGRTTWNGDPALYSGRHGARFRDFWSFGKRPTRWGSMYALPLWLPTLPLLLTTAAAWRLDTLARRRLRAGRCPWCGYDLTGLPALAACPECGAASHPSTRPNHG